MLVAKTQIKSYFQKDKCYALVNDRISIIKEHGIVLCVRNLETGETFPTKLENIMEVPDDSNLPKEREADKKPKQKEKPPTSQLSLF